MQVYGAGRRAPRRARRRPERDHDERRRHARRMDRREPTGSWCSRATAGAHHVRVGHPDAGRGVGSIDAVFGSDCAERRLHAAGRRLHHHDQRAQQLRAGARTLDDQRAAPGRRRQPGRRPLGGQRSRPATTEQFGCVGPLRPRRRPSVVARAAATRRSGSSRRTAPHLTGARGDNACGGSVDRQTSTRDPGTATVDGRATAPWPWSPASTLEEWSLGPDARATLRWSLAGAGPDRTQSSDRPRDSQLDAATPRSVEAVRRCRGGNPRARVRVDRVAVPCGERR